MAQSEILRFTPRWAIKEFEPRNRKEGREMSAGFLKSGVAVGRKLVLRLEGEERNTGFVLNIFEKIDDSWQSVSKFPIRKKRSYKIISLDPSFPLSETYVRSYIMTQKYAGRQEPRSRLKFRVGKNRQLVERALDLGIILPPVGV